MTTEAKKNTEIKNLTTFKIGGAISEVFFPETTEEFVEILKKNPDIMVFGNLSNTLVSDFGFDGKIILTSNLNKITVSGTNVVAGCGVKGPKLAQELCKAGLSGLEFMIGFPGSVGGEVCMNASANSQTISDYLTSVTCYSKQKGLVKYSKEEMDFGYRTSRCQNEYLIVLEAEFELSKKAPQDIQKQMDENLAFRKEHQPSLSLPNCGSIFKNPPNNSAGRLLDSIGAKDFVHGGVKVWENHANFIVNYRAGTSLDVLELMFDMKQKVQEKYGIELEPEIKFLGGNNEKENELCKTLYKVK